MALREKNGDPELERLRHKVAHKLLEVCPVVYNRELVLKEYKNLPFIWSFLSVL